MSFVGDFLGEMTGGITGAKQAGEAGERAGELQAEAAAEGIAETRRQFDALIELMSPYVTAGTGAISAQQGLMGLGGPEAQAQAIQALQAGPEFQALTQTGEEALLQRASATGGLRGGNTEAALAQFRPQMLSQLINQKLSQYGGLSQLGQAAAAGQASAGLQTGGQVAGLLGQAGAARAGGAISKGGVVGQTFQNTLDIAGLFAPSF
jgi:hypothetical protein